MRLFKSKKLIAGVVVLGLVGAGSTAALMPRDTPKEEVKYVATSQKAKVMKEDSVETPFVESENTAVVEVAEQPAPVPTPEPAAPTEATHSNNPYTKDGALWYVFDRREKSGKRQLGVWGYANTWAVQARDAGYVVDSIPQAGDVFSTGYTPYFVESVEEDSMTSTTFYPTGAKTQVFPKAQYPVLKFIH